MSHRLLPEWFRQEIPDARTLKRIEYVCGRSVLTVCLQAHCPNVGACFRAKKLAFMILGSACTRHCSFCAVKKNENRLLGVDHGEPLRISDLVKRFGLGYVVLTSVARDDLVDGGASHFARTIEEIRRGNPYTKVEALIPDFLGKASSLAALVNAGPAVIAHNIETVPRLYASARPEASYGRSLAVLRKVKDMDGSIITKSSLMAGLGETEEEIMRVMQDLRTASCDIFTIGQYLAPSSAHYPVQELVPPGRFEYYRAAGYALGFKAVAAGPLVRSSYRAQEVYEGSLCTT